MKHKIIIGGLSAVILVLSFLVSSHMAEQSKARASANPVYAEVQLESSKANPDTLTVPTGETVRFNAADGQQHNLSLGKGGEEHQHYGAYSSGEFAANEAWEVKFSKAGTYYFHDHNNPDINILVVAY